MTRMVDLYEKADCLIRAAEEWDQTYKNNPATFDQLIKAESRLMRKLRTYMRDLAGRAVNFVDWSEYRYRAIKAFDVVVDLEDAAFTEEATILLNILYEDIVAASGAGAVAGQANTNISLGLDEFDVAIQSIARKQVGQLVKDVLDVTRDKISSSIATSLQLGESTDQATARLMDILDDPSRAERIARTESVRAYQNGLLEFGRQSKAVGKYWATVQVGACPICQSNGDAGTIGLDEQFPEGDDAPPAHPNCRCGLVLQYDDGSTSEGDDGSDDGSDDSSS